MADIDLIREIGCNDTGVKTLYLSFVGVAAGDPLESTFYGRGIADITRNGTGEYFIDLNCKDVIARVVAVRAGVNDAATGDSSPFTATTHVDESQADGLRLRVFTRQGGTKTDATTRRVWVEVKYTTTFVGYAYA